ncbi:DUF5994 family protein [Nocardia heshunensis]
MTSSRRDLAAELPGLIAKLVGGPDPIHRVIYHLDEWGPAPRKIDIGGRWIRLGGYRHLPAGILEFHGVDSDSRLTLRLDSLIGDTELGAAQQRWESEGGAGRRVTVSDRERAGSR